ncbi:MAG: tetratricopeptide repeat protein [Luteolibacter sp.]
MLPLFGSWASLAAAQTADETAEFARQAAKADRHAESIDAFRRAIGTAPERRNEWLLELADQLTWAKRLKESIPLYREAARSGDPDQERRARRGLARALSWDGNYTAALAEYDRLLAWTPDDPEVRLARAEVVSWVRLNTDAMVDRARQAAKQDQHTESIHAYQQAMKAAPERRGEWLIELADQLTWSKRLKEAILLYQEAAGTHDVKMERPARRGLGRALAWDGDHAGALAAYDRVLALAPEDREVRLARAELLSWRNDLEAAMAEYEEVLRDHPEDVEARRSVGRILSWRGRHREAAAGMREFLQDHPQDRGATLILAEAYDWMGKPDEAERVLREHLVADAGDTRAVSMLEQLEFYQRPAVRFDWRESHQSDEVRTSVFSFSSGIPLADGGSFIGFRYDLGSYVPPSGPVEEIQVQRAGFQVSHRLNDFLDWNGGLFLNAIDTRGASGDHEIVTYETYLTLRPNDLLRFDLGSSSWIFDSQEALRDGLRAVQGSASMDFMPDDLTKFSGRFSLADYSDGNARTWWQFEMERRIWRRPDVVLGYRYTGFDFDEPWQRGYYSPDLYHSNEFLVRSWGWWGDRFRWQLASSVGYEHELSESARLIWSAGGGVAWKIQRQLEVELGYEYSSSSATSANGFDRGTARLGLRYIF